MQDNKNSGKRRFNRALDKSKGNENKASEKARILIAKYRDDLQKRRLEIPTENKKILQDIRNYQRSTIQKENPEYQLDVVDEYTEDFVNNYLQNEEDYDPEMIRLNNKIGKKYNLRQDLDNEKKVYNHKFGKRVARELAKLGDEIKDYEQGLGQDKKAEDIKKKVENYEKLGFKVPRVDKYNKIKKEVEKNKVYDETYRKLEGKSLAKMLVDQNNQLKSLTKTLHQIKFVLGM